jgi:thiol-disulfide isomerase/thioredoxin
MLESVSHLVELFYSEHCFGCPEARQLLQRVASEHPEVVIIERNIDDDVDHRLAMEYRLIATPAFVIDRSNVLYGVPQPQKLEARIGASTPALA